MTKVTSYNFRKVGAHYEYRGENDYYECSPAVLECFKAQYTMMGYKVEVDTPELVRIIKIEKI